MAKVPLFQALGAGVIAEVGHLSWPTGRHPELTRAIEAEAARRGGGKNASA